MANYCEGTLKLRGQRDKLLKFLNQYIRDGIEYKADDDDDCFEIKPGPGFTVERIVIDDFSVTVTQNRTNGDIFQCAINVRAAWSLNAKNWKDPVRIFGLDLQFTGYEQGMEFIQRVEIIKGEITRDDRIGYEDYFWSCPHPTYGG